MAEGLAEAGARVMVTGRTLSALEQVAAGIKDKGGKALARVCDARDEVQCTAMVEAAEAAFGRLDGAIVNHGVGLHRHALETTTDEFQSMMNDNLTSVFVTVRAFGKHWKSLGRGGSLVLISSNASFLAYDELLAYGVSKAGIDQMCRQLASEWAPLGIRVNAIGPGYMSASMKGIESIYEEPEVKARILGLIPAGRYGDPRELVGAAQYFLSDAAGYTTGQYLAVDGGYSLI
jgi:NAD(P)-dependent dehydrogenase (short-subunit alcohol dehydrogenase family)